MAVPTDQWRGHLLAAMQRLRGPAPLRMVTSNWTLYEALALAQRREKRRALELFRLIEQGAEIVTVDAAIEEEALRRFLRWKDKSASVVDHANTLVAAREGCDVILSFDADFVPLAAAAGIALA